MNHMYIQYSVLSYICVYRMYVCMLCVYICIYVSGTAAGCADTQFKKEQMIKCYGSPYLNVQRKSRNKDESGPMAPFCLFCLFCFFSGKDRG